jgi:hypothetical protein
VPGELPGELPAAALEAVPVVLLVGELAEELALVPGKALEAARWLARLEVALALPWC